MSWRHTLYSTENPLLTALNYHQRKTDEWPIYEKRFITVFKLLNPLCAIVPIFGNITLGIFF